MTGERPCWGTRRRSLVRVQHAEICGHQDESATRRNEERRGFFLCTANVENACSLREFGIILPSNSFAKPSSGNTIVGQNHVATARFTAASCCGAVQPGSRIHGLFDLNGHG